MSMNKLFNRMPAACLAFAAVLLLVAPGAQAMKVKNQNLTQLISQAQSIVFGTVTSVSDGVAKNGMPYTEITLSVGSSAKGKITEGSDYTFRQFGLLKPRTMANGKALIDVTPEGFPRWHAGETVVAFLYKPASRTGLQTTAGMAQGKFQLVNGMLVNDYNNLGLFEGVEIDKSLLSSAERNMITKPGAVDAAAFMDLVGRAVAENWIANGEMK
jgi:hypothetical protein